MQFINNLLTQLSNPLVLRDLLKNVQLFVILAMGWILILSCGALIKVELDKKGVKGKVKNFSVKKFLYIDKIESNIDILFKERRKKAGLAGKVTKAIVVGALTTGAYMCLQGQIFIGFITPYGLFFIVNKVSNLMITSQNEYVLRDLPETIDHINRALSKYDDLKTVMYYAADSVAEPMKSMLQDLSRKMNSHSPEDVLDEFMREQNNIWLYTFSFTLISYVQDADKQEVKVQLEELKSMIIKENKVKVEERMQRKLTVGVNYVLCAVAAICLVANVIFNPGGKTFFFSTPEGTGTFVIGVGLLIISIFSNILIGAGKEGGK